MKPKTVRLALAGLGNVGRSFLRLLAERGELLREGYKLQLRLTGAADSRGAVLAPRGIDPATLLRHKEVGNHAGNFPYGGKRGVSAMEMLEQAKADVLLEALPVELRTAMPGLACVRLALQRSMHVVLADKGPLALVYQDLHDQAAAHGVKLAFSATVCGGLPVINMGQRDLVAARIERIEGIFNSTSNYVLSQMTEGREQSEAVREAQRRGIAEADPYLDIEGWDTANKLIIVCNAILNFPATMTDVTVLGIQNIGPADLTAARSRGEVIKLVGAAVRHEKGYRLGVYPARLPLDHPLARVDGWQMGVVFYTDIYETIYAVIDERGPMATAAAMLRDLINLGGREIQG